MEYKKKLIEVALPLEAINKESAREKSIRNGHPSTLHLWWARRPLASCRAVLFASLVDDPSSNPDKFPTEEDQEKERQRLFDIIEELVKWENSNNESILDLANNEILKSSDGNPPPVLDPFCGGGSIPLEAQRLGLRAYGSDLNPVAVMITKAMIEIPPQFSNKPPINPESVGSLGCNSHWKGSSGLAADVRYYGKLIKDEVEKKIGHLYPKVKLKDGHDNSEATVVAWIWTRTVKCPNPACGCKIPLVRSFELSKKKGNYAWVEPKYNKEVNKLEFVVHTTSGKVPQGTVNRKGAKCICCGTPANFDYIRSEGKSGRMGIELMAIVVEGKKGKIFVSPSYEQSITAYIERPDDIPNADLPHNPRDFKTPNYGITTFADLFTNRQLNALYSFSNMIIDTRTIIEKDAILAGLNEFEAKQYSNAVSVYLAFALDRSTNYWSSLTPWGGEFIVQTFSRQALPMVWDFAEANPFSNSTGNWLGAVEWICKCLEMLSHKVLQGYASQKNAMDIGGIDNIIVSTDPPYYDNIGYADLSDYFYLWLRRTLKNIYPDLFATMLAPKEGELVAMPYRFNGDKEKAKLFFEEGLLKVFQKIRSVISDKYPITVYFAFKQTDSNSEDDAPNNIEASSGWETMLSSLINAGFKITGTWPMRTERPTGTKVNMNALASSIVLVCRKRSIESQTVTRREFLNTLRKELYNSLKKLQSGNIAPVDLAQASIGPGMSVFSSYSKVLEADGTPMSVRTALQIINQELDAYLASQEGEMDSDTRFCVAWYEQFGMNEAAFGEADVLARAKNTSVDRLVNDGVLFAAKGKVRLLKRDELEDNWDPDVYKKDMIWMYTQQLVKTLVAEGEEKTAALVTKMRNDASERAKDLAYRLYTIAERKGLTEEALAYNSLVVAWPDIQKKAAELSTRPYEQMDLF